MSEHQTAGAAEQAHGIDDLLAMIRAAVTIDASPELRAVGAASCRRILATLESGTAQPSPLNPAQIASAVAMLRGVPPDQLLDLAIAKLRAALPTGTEIPRVQPVQFQFVPIAPGVAAKKTP